MFKSVEIYAIGPQSISFKDVDSSVIKYERLTIDHLVSMFYEYKSMFLAKTYSGDDTYAILLELPQHELYGKMYVLYTLGTTPLLLTLLDGDKITANTLELIFQTALTENMNELEKVYVTILNHIIDGNDFSVSIDKLTDTEDMNVSIELKVCDSDELIDINDSRLVRDIARSVAVIGKIEPKEATGEGMPILTAEELSSKIHGEISSETYSDNSEINEDKLREYATPLKPFGTKFDYVQANEKKISVDPDIEFITAVELLVRNGKTSKKKDTDKIGWKAKQNAYTINTYLLNNYSKNEAQLVLSMILPHYGKKYYKYINKMMENRMDGAAFKLVLLATQNTKIKNFGKSKFLKIMLKTESVNVHFTPTTEKIKLKRAKKEKSKKSKCSKCVKTKG